MKVRLRDPAGQTMLSLPNHATVGELRASIVEKTSLAEFDVRYGYPPKPLLLHNYDDNTKLSALEIKLDGEQLIVSRTQPSPSTATDAEAKLAPPAAQTTSSAPKDSGNQGQTQPAVTKGFSFGDIGTAPPPSTAKPTSASKPNKPLSLSRKQSTMSASDSPEIPVPSHAATMVLRIMPDDNSCLFRAVNTACIGASMDNMVELRSIIAQYIQANPETYSAVVLDQEPDDYCRWIQTEDAWGGSIELDILSKHFETEICSIDVQTLRVDRYNEGKPKRCILVYSGIHYDTIALSSSDAPYTQAYNPPDFDIKVFDSFDEEILQMAIELCRVLKERHYYTDTAGFSIRCNVCGVISRGEKGATKHASETGHWDFAEAG